ncbi:PIG-L family deacetylase [Candidatus Woesearchaeota archaeon]|nr:PIG-L family deacetylase [Candidatus Woesearchaeota archaeon]
MKMKKLVISPHIDDEVLGCGGILDKDTFVLHCGVEDRSYASAEERLKEIKEAQKIAGFQMKLLKNEVNHYAEADLIGDFESTINEIKPEMAFIPHPSYNQDHRAVYNAALIALRQHDINFFVKKVLVYEQPQDVFWDFNSEKGFKPNYFVPIDIERKLKLYSLLKTQVRPFRSLEHVRAIAVLRGGQSNCRHAEGFEALRWID